MYPNHVYRPQRSTVSKCKGKSRKALTEGEQDTDPEPTPLTYWTVQIPTVYMPSCSPSPALRSQRTPLPKHSLNRDVPARGTYIPDDTLMHQRLMTRTLRYASFLRLFPDRCSSLRLITTRCSRVCSIYLDRTCLLTGATRCHHSRSLKQIRCSHRTALFPPSRTSTQSPDGALGFVPQVNGSYFDQLSILLNGES